MTGLMRDGVGKEDRQRNSGSHRCGEDSIEIDDDVDSRRREWK